ncbi:MAG: glycosyltransferase family 4 protein [Syntrophus sp. (in: bacteria)]
MKKNVFPGRGDMSLRILIFNLRDRANPEAGGAEVFIHEVAKRWVAGGHEATLVSSLFRNASQREVLEGVTVIRMGNPVTVYPLARRYYVEKLRGRFDVVIDEYTCRPFMTHRFVREPLVFLVNELAGEKYGHVLPPVLSHLFQWWIEPFWMRRYKDFPTLTISRSTQKDLKDLGFSDVAIVPMGVGFEPVAEIPAKEDAPTLLFVGLLKETNLADHVIEAFRIVCRVFPLARLWIAGRGPELPRLKRLAEDMDVTFLGYVSEEEKIRRMQRAHLFLMPAVREGWGLVVTEANACGTPAIGYDVPGLRDSIRDGQTGCLVQPDPEALAHCAIKLLGDDGLRTAYAERALAWSRTLTWDRTAEEFLAILERVCLKNIRP